MKAGAWYYCCVYTMSTRITLSRLKSILSVAVLTTMGCICVGDFINAARPLQHNMFDGPISQTVRT